ncbi:DUF1349 domain-containing protein [Jiulongibacter sp. NS-SX5]|uniref:DUF1349 domain-containing protein n=1 Tax=Jiulongibacter sp. NS-SX5 TaxID=3463854 RepID=UPI004058B03A
MKLTQNLFILAISTIAFLSCSEKPTQVIEEEIQTVEINLENNFLTEITLDSLGDFQWLNKPDTFSIKDGSLFIQAESRTDFFNNPEDLTKTASAPLFYQKLKGDFIATALVKPDFGDQWNAVALMIHQDTDNWIKFAFENSDATGKGIVTVVTKGVSDDANGVRLNDEDQVWLKIARKGNIFSMLWSLDGEDYKMARLTTLPEVEEVKIGLEAQSPIGAPALHEIKYFNIERETVDDLRKGE